MKPTRIGTVRTTITGSIAVLLAAACWALSGVFVKLIEIVDAWVVVAGVIIPLAPDAKKAWVESISRR